MKDDKKPRSKEDKPAPASAPLSLDKVTLLAYCFTYADKVKKLDELMTKYPNFCSKIIKRCIGLTPL